MHPFRIMSSILEQICCSIGEKGLFYEIFTGVEKLKIFCFRFDIRFGTCKAHIETIVESDQPLWQFEDQNKRIVSNLIGLLQTKSHQIPKFQYLSFTMIVQNF